MRWTGVAPAVYKSSAGVRRLFCEKCGSPMAYDSDNYDDEIHLYAVSLDNPDDFKPTFHVYYGERVSWVDFDNDGLEKFEGNGGLYNPSTG